MTVDIDTTEESLLDRLRREAAEAAEREKNDEFAEVIKAHEEKRIDKRLEEIKKGGTGGK